MSSSNSMFREDLLARALSGLGLALQPGLFQNLRAAYAAASRYYHCSDHIAACLARFQPYHKDSDHPWEVEIALWFHDAIYDTHRSDNEERSACWACDYLATQGAPANVVRRIDGLIMATKSHNHLSTSDQKIMADIDLAILGQKEKTFASYQANIRREYHWVPETIYREGRCRVLRKFLERERIYHTERCFECYETQARSNLSQAIAELQP